MKDEMEKGEKVFSSVVTYTSFVVFVAAIALFIYDELYNTKLSLYPIFILTLTPVFGLVVYLPFASRKLKLLTIAALVEMAVALYFAFS